jgi:hypothetical protein
MFCTRTAWRDTIGRLQNRINGSQSAAIFRMPIGIL